MTHGEPQPHAASEFTPEDIENPAPTIEEIFLSHYGILLNIATRYRASDPDALVQTVFEKAQRHMNDNPDTKLYVGWYFRVLYTTMINEYRKSGRKPEQLMDPTSEYVYFDAPDTRAESGFTSIELGTVLGEIACVLSNKNEQWLDIFIRNKLLDQSYGEISRSLNIPEGTVSSTLKRAKSTLAKSPELRALYGAA